MENTIWKNSVGIPAKFAKMASSCAYVGNLNTEASAVCTSQHDLCIIFSMARFSNKNYLVELLEDEVNCVQFFVRCRNVKY